MHILAATVIAIAISTLPQQPIIERGRADQRLNFDFIIQNPTATKLEISELELTVRGAKGEMLSQRRLGSNGDSIATLPNRSIEPNGKLVVFNPFYSFDSALPLQDLEYRFAFANDTSATVHVRPRAYTGTRFELPVTGRVFIHDGHDFLSHHRRLDITGDMTTALHIDANMSRYAYDFCVIDENGRMYRGDGMSNTDWFGFGTPILAPAAGRVVESVNSIPDNSKDKPVPMAFEDVIKNLKRIFGNYVLIDHGNGEFSMLAHMKQGSVGVAAGDAVKRGQKIGEMGMSGDAFLVHLHYQLQSDAKFGEGLPSYFDGVKLLHGARWITPPDGQIDSGDVVTRR